MIGEYYATGQEFLTFKSEEYTQMPPCGKHDILSILYVFNPNDILTSARMIWEVHKTGATEPQFLKNWGWNEKSGSENSTQGKK
jgi:hypothetical protein